MCAFQLIALHKAAGEKPEAEVIEPVPRAETKWMLFVRPWECMQIPLRATVYLIHYRFELLGDRLDGVRLARARHAGVKRECAVHETNGTADEVLGKKAAAAGGACADYLATRHRRGPRRRGGGRRRVHALENLSRSRKHSLFDA